jgi:hypothetical protein
MDIRELPAYQNAVATALADVDVELAKAQSDLDLLSNDVGERVFAENYLARCIANAQAVKTLAANIPEGISNG